jgi:hypothetical protein
MARSGSEKLRAINSLHRSTEIVSIVQIAALSDFLVILPL